MGFKMGVGSDLLPESANKKDDLLQEMSRLSSSELISFLKSTFLSRELAMVERVVVDRETKLKLEIEDLKKDYVSLKKKYDEDVSDTTGIQNELNATKHECWELKEINSHLVGERKIAQEKVKNAEEKCLKMSHGMKEKVDETIVELRSKNCELECAKAKAESEMQVWKRKYDELENRVRHLETKCELVMSVETNPLMDGGDLGSQGVGKESVGEKGMCSEAAEKTGEKVVGGNGIGVEDGRACENGVRSHQMKAVEFAGEHVKAEVIDSEDVKVTNCNATKANLETGAGSSCRSPVKDYGGLPCAGSGKALDRSIIEISDSDDDVDNYCCPERVSAGNGTVSGGDLGSQAFCQGVEKKSVGEKGIEAAEKTGEKVGRDNGIGVEDGRACENGVRTEKNAVEFAGEHVKEEVIDWEDVKVEADITNCNATKANLEIGAGSSCRSLDKAYGGLRCEGSKKALDNNIIEVSDNDDDDCCPERRVSAGNGTVSGETSAQNGIGTLKRKVDSFLNTDENKKSYDPDLKKVKDSVCGPDGSAERVFTPASLDASVLKRREECSGFLNPNGLTSLSIFSDSSDSDDSSSSSDDDFVFVNLFSSWRDKKLDET